MLQSGLDPKGVKWMGSVPDNWSTVAVKRHFDIQLGKMLQNKPESEQDELVPYAKALHVLWGRVETEDLPEMYATASDIRQYGIKNGDLLVCEGGEVGRAGIVDSPPNPCIIQNALHRVRARDTGDVRFLQYILHAVSSAGWFDVLCSKATIAHFTREKFAELQIPYPSSVQDQRAIAAFLDRETTRIDALIEKKERQIELLEEKRAALISHAVTKGLDPDVPMKESGVEWLGEIPAHWQFVQVGYLARVLNGSTPRRNRFDYWTDGTIPWLSSGKVNDDVITEPSEWITEAALHESALEIVPAGSVVIGIVGQGRTRGMAALMGIDAAINQNMVAIIPRDKLQGRFLHYVLQKMYKPIREYGRGANQAALNCELVREIRIPVPPIREQYAMSAFLDRESGEVNVLVKKIRESIETLREYRTALISAAVTGKIDVRRQPGATHF